MAKFFVVVKMISQARVMGTLTQSQGPYVPFPVQTLALLRSAGYARRKCSVFTPPDSPTRSFTGELVFNYGDCRQSPFAIGWMVWANKPLFNCLCF